MQTFMNETDELGCTPLHYASKVGHISTIENLLKMGAHLDAKNNKRESPLHFAARCVGRSAAGGSSRARGRGRWGRGAGVAGAGCRGCQGLGWEQQGQGVGGARDGGGSSRGRG